YSYDYLKGVDDLTRMGALRFKEIEDDNFINMDSRLSIPPLTSVKELTRISQEYEEADEKNELPEKKWILQLEHPGTSVGGARPKANVTDDANNLWIAKFPSRNDLYDVALWEHFCHILAKNALINVAETQLLSVDNNRHALLSKRFDRTNLHKRIHFSSAMAMIGLVDGDNFETGHGYLDIVDAIVQKCTNVDVNLEELYRRVAFNICVGNSDDHFRNHGFLLTPKGWTLAPAYDLNPTTSEYQGLLIDANSNEASLERLKGACNDYFISQEKASQIIKQVKTAVRSWRAVANHLQIPTSEQNRFAARLDSRVH
ncbi:MAG: HipA domain-containing protein, partial [Prevotella sp.]|nr:HipA domain-containing protein [Prevotella sp.]